MFHQTQLLLEKVDAFEKVGQWRDAVQICETLFRDGTQTRDLPDILEALLRLGLLYSAHEETELAEDYFSLALEISSRTGDTLYEARSLNSLGVGHQRTGNVTAASEFFHAAQRAAASIDDGRVKGDIDVNLGIGANISGDLSLALSHYQRALGEYRSINAPQRIARVLNNLGMLYTDLGDLAMAETTLSEALAISRSVGDLRVEGIVLTNQTELLLERDDLVGARASCDDAFEIASRIGDETLKAEILKSYGVIYRKTNKLHLAVSHFTQAIDLAASLRRPLIEADTNRELALALRQQDRNQDALAALNRAHDLFTTLQARSRQADIDKRFRQLENDFLSLVAKWGESIEAKDRYTRGHCQRVAAYACELAKLAGLSSQELIWFRMGAFLHDVGKIAVPEDILNKPGKLTDDERIIMERHTIVGYETLTAIEFPWDIRPMVRSHHERWDGKGYPDGLGGLEIPLSARILHIADVYDALTTTRSYRRALSPSEAFDIMVRDSGSFDPELFDIFGQLLPELSGLSEHPPAEYDPIASSI